MLVVVKLKLIAYFLFLFCYLTRVKELCTSICHIAIVVDVKKTRLTFVRLPRLLKLILIDPTIKL